MAGFTGGGAATIGHVYLFFLFLRLKVKIKKQESDIQMDRECIALNLKEKCFQISVLKGYEG